MLPKMYWKSGWIKSGLFKCVTNNVNGEREKVRYIHLERNRNAKLE